MSKKLIAALMAIAAFAAFGMASTASAAPVITHPTGTVLAPGTLIDGTNISVTKFTAGTILTVECATGTLTGKLITNTTAGGFSGEITKATYSGTGTSGDCTATGTFFKGSAAATPETGTNGLPWCIKNTINDNFELRGGACSAASRPIRFALDLTGLVTCTYERTGSITGTFETHPEDAKGKINSGQPFTRVSGFGCPETGELDQEFTMETDTTAASDPLYISS